MMGAGSVFQNCFPPASTNFDALAQDLSAKNGDVNSQQATKKSSDL
jgi:hypothetical protein